MAPECKHPTPTVVRRMISFTCEACGEMWAEKDDVGNYKAEYEAEHKKLLDFEENVRKDANTVIERERRLTTENVDLYKKIAEIKSIAGR